FGGSKPAESKKEEPSKPAPSFSFGGSKPAESKTEESSKPAPSFSFGGSKPAETKKEEPSKPAAGGFSFGTSKAEDKKPEEKPSTSLTATEAPKKVTFTSDTTTGGDKKPQVELQTIKPEPMSIKNKTLEDLIAKWTTQLSTSSKIFEAYSEKMNQWDQVLTSSSDRISKLYNDSMACEQKQSKIDQTLSYIENQQKELDSLLSGYNRQSETMLASINQAGENRGMISDSTVLTNDQQREKSYKLAETLENRLDSLGTNFQSLISEVNEVSDSLNKSLLSSSSKSLSDETSLEDILKLLNSHLESLNWIEKNEASLKDQIEVLKKNHDNY
ncbi:hypothetical protein CANARDRAFT_6430, partial [[Candida] arabinofermentans NRRL YB-2248]